MSMPTDVRTNEPLTVRQLQVLITNGNLELVDDGVEYIIHTDKQILDQ